MRTQIFGEKDRFAIEVECIDRGQILGEVHIWIAGEQVNNKNPAYLPTVCGQLKGYAHSHRSATDDRAEFQNCSEVQIFELMHHAITNDTPIGNIGLDQIYHKHRVHSIDDIVDDWEIYIINEDDNLLIVWKGRSEHWCPKHHLSKVWHTRILRDEFLAAIDDFASFIEKQEAN